MDDGLVTYDEVFSWLSQDVQEALTLALPPKLRGWWTEAEAQAEPDRRWVELSCLLWKQSRFLPAR